MDSPAERLDLLISILEKSAERPVHDVVCDFEEAVILSITIGRTEDSLRLIQEYSNYFHYPVPFDIRFFCTFQRSVVAWRSGDLKFAEGSIKESMKIAEDNGSVQSAARSSMALGVLSVEKSQFGEALVLMKKAEAGLRIDGGYLLARCLNWLGQICFSLDLFQESWNYYAEALELNEELSLTGDQAYVFSNMGLLCQRMGLYKQAEESFRSSMKIQEESGNNYGFADSLANLGLMLAEKKGLYRKAAPILEKAYKMHLDNKAISKAGLVLVNYDAPDKSILHITCLAGLSTNQSAFILQQPINRIHIGRFSPNIHDKPLITPLSGCWHSPAICCLTYSRAFLVLAA